MKYKIFHYENGYFGRELWSTIRETKEEAEKEAARYEGSWIEVV